MIQRCRGDHNRLGHALMLCYLRYPGRPLRAAERPPAALISFVAEQIDVLPEAIDDYPASLTRVRCIGVLIERKFFCDKGLTFKQRKSPMPTQCNPDLFAFAPAEGRPVVVSFEGGAITSDAGALLLGATDRVLVGHLGWDMPFMRAALAA